MNPAKFVQFEEIVQKRKYFGVHVFISVNIEDLGSFLLCSNDPLTGLGPMVSVSIRCM